ncbi:uncharacterized protein M421DRAFT_7779 [Didymella exigua CBS 183.55]|uniref:Retrovirus-related Pol polyprotein from transposon TNT 1-94-like beta-barrel domain-containing protein n=1 Tax=Didymella exigua CBS 183.55 TaxID=1150837 RepID=A0A6A5RDW6_9PLEO|nr:uncharacterized protein M421DRAFT_7779 [Didymella exigua CBS 183.55]KAF1925510.1 hypothetical protein M421DRAFT_7779 [Didymella exigua CBS 183.55]
MTNSKTPETDLCPDWIYSDSSDVHIAKDRAWFTSYHVFPSHVTSLYAIGAPIPVLGIGTIKLPVKATRGSFTSYGASPIELHNVLHAPTYFCNLLGRPLGAIYQISLGGSVHEGGRPNRGGLALNGRQVTHFQPGPISFFSLAVLPPPGTSFGPSAFRTGGSRAVSAHWPHAERSRWHAIPAHAALERDPLPDQPPYALHEMEFVNRRWGSEFRFLAQYGLGLLEERDRSEGRRIARALLQGRDPEVKVGV